MSDLTPSASSTTQLVPVFHGQIGGAPAQVCDGRTLHAFLENGELFPTWIKQRVEQYGFQENQDFVSFLEKTKKPQGGRPGRDYHLCLDMAKELSMVENNAKGRQARRYFIDCERQAMAAALAQPTPINPASDPITPEVRAAINRRAHGLAGQEFERMRTVLTEVVRAYAQEHPGADLVGLVGAINPVPAEGPSAPSAPPVETAPEYLSAADEQSLSRLAWLVSARMPYPKSVAHAFWHRLRLVTGVPSPGKFEVRHLPLLAAEVERFQAVVEAFHDVQYRAAERFTKRVLRTGADAEPFLAEIAREYEGWLNASDAELKSRLKPWQVRQNAALMGPRG